MGLNKLDEHSQQSLLFEWASLNLGRFPELKYFHASLNGAKLPFSRDQNGNRYSNQAKRLKKEGMKKGVPDTCLPVPRSIYRGLYIELKTEEGKPTPEQLDFVSFLNWQGYFACFCYGFNDAVTVLEWYLQLPKRGIDDQPPDQIPVQAVRPPLDPEHMALY